MRLKAQVAGIAAMAAGVLALSPALASAHTFVAPGAIAFPGSTEVGKTSAPQVTVVYTYCTVYTTSCNQPGIFQPAPVVTGDFLQTNTCGTGAIAQTSPGPVPDCVFTVTFKPKAPGLRTGTLTVGSELGGETQPGTVNLTGAGVPGPSTSATGTTTKKKCKVKKRSAQIAKKKCKKK